MKSKQNKPCNVEEYHHKYYFSTNTSIPKQKFTNKKKLLKFSSPQQQIIFGSHSRNFAKNSQYSSEKKIVVPPENSLNKMKHTLFKCDEFFLGITN